MSMVSSLNVDGILLSSIWIYLAIYYFSEKLTNVFCCKNADFGYIDYLMLLWPMITTEKYQRYLKC